VRYRSAFGCMVMVTIFCASVSAIDSGAPQISAVATALVTTSTATITWVTDEPSSSQVQYGLTSIYTKSTRRNKKKRTTHQVTIKSLSSGTTYHFRTKSKDKSGNIGYSDDFVFTTTPVGAPVAPGNLQSTATSTSEVQLSWSDNSTNEQGFDIYESSDGVNFQQITNVGANAQNYSVQNLHAQTLYYFRVCAYNASGDSYTSNTSSVTTQAPKAFPNAVGFGVQTPGGRGGAILKVTNLNDSGVGSLRAAVESNGPRTVVFEVSGTIVLKSELKIRDPYLTVAGQTAPSPGITLRAGEFNILTHDVIVQHIRIRVGDQIPEGTDASGLDGMSSDGLMPYNNAFSWNVVIDHVSISWAIDENASSWGDDVHDVTFSNCIISEGLYNSVHPEGIHSMGMLLTPNARNVAVVNNLFAHDADRNPLISNGASVVVANNLFYNWEGGKATNIGHTSNFIPAKYTNDVSVINNRYIGGPNTTPFTYAISTTTVLDPGSKLFYSGNSMENVKAEYRNLSTFDPVVNTPPISIDGFTPANASTVEASVLANAGARPLDRDAVDARIVSEVQTRGGQIINSQNEVGGWPNLATNVRTLTIPANPNGDEDGDGYTNIEEQLLFPLAQQLEE
jgi:hypothetical protein